MTVASRQINLQSKHDLICHLAKVKAATSTHSMAEVIPFFSLFIIPLESNASIKPKAIQFIHNKENNIRNIVLVLMFHQLLAIKHHRLRDSKFGRVEAWVWSPTEVKKTRRSVRSYNRAFKILLFSQHYSGNAVHIPEQSLMIY